MDRLKEFANNVWEEFGIYLAAFLLVAVGITLLFSGFSFIAVPLILGSIIFTIMLGLASTLIISSIFAVLLKALSIPLNELSNIWFAGGAHDKFFTLLDKTGYLSTILVAFLLACALTIVLRTLTSVLGSIKPVHINKVRH